MDDPGNGLKRLHLHIFLAYGKQPPIELADVVLQRVNTVTLFLNALHEYARQPICGGGQLSFDALHQSPMAFGQQLDLVTLGSQCPSPVLRISAGFQRNDTGWTIGMERRHAIALALLALDLAGFRIDDVKLEDASCDVQAGDQQFCSKNGSSGFRRCYQAC